jgi:hypothetical protein
VSNQYSFGYLLVIGYLSKDNVASWCSSIALAHLIADNQQFKEEILKVVLSIDQSQANAKSLMEISIDLLENVDFKTHFSYFIHSLFFSSSRHLHSILVLLYSSSFVPGYLIVH